MSKKLDITGERYGALVALYDTNTKKNGTSIWMFRCDCGKTKMLPLNHVRYGEIKTCGCRIGLKHSKRKQRIKVNDTFGNLTVIEILGQENNKGHYLSKVKCTCGNIFITRDSFLITGKRIKCRECSKKDTQFYKHGLTNTSLFSVWQDMRARCYNSNDKSFHNYGGRGIAICDEWKNNFQAFYDWAMSHGYKKGLWIERKNVNGNYEPNNCSWETQKKQARNKQNTIYIEYEGKKLPIGEIAEITGIFSTTIYERIFKYGWNEYDATHIIPTKNCYTTKSMRKTVLTDLKTGEVHYFCSSAQASRFIKKGNNYLIGKSYKLGKSFVCENYLVDIQDSYYMGERNG